MEAGYQQSGFAPIQQLFFFRVNGGRFGRRFRLHCFCFVFRFPRIWFVVKSFLKESERWTTFP